MKKIIILGVAMTVVIAMLVSCEKNKIDKIGTDPSNDSYPATAHVIYKAVTDIDGNVYDAVQIGNQVWMAENLRTTRYADGSVIMPGLTVSDLVPLRYFPASNGDNVSKYGYLYNWLAVMRDAEGSDNNSSKVQGVCPNGWHVPSDAEWVELTSYVKSQSEYWCDETSENVAKSIASNDGWLEYGVEEECAVSHDPSVNNATGFSARPAGSYWGFYSYFGYSANFWSATALNDSMAYGHSVGFEDVTIYRNYYYTNIAFSVRCVRD
ncbi:MAG: fibrobacter succinogenes major paralogous domain-containing protein [Bacteroidales bacterium]|nr:fibrobacter succinogenes major paralogous domain-containing protein [Bacteroidales bacterium]